MTKKIITAALVFGNVFMPLVLAQRLPLSSPPQVIEPRIVRADPDPKIEGTIAAKMLDELPPDFINGLIANKAAREEAGRLSNLMTRTMLGLKSPEEVSREIAELFEGKSDEEIDAIFLFLDDRKLETFVEFVDREKGGSWGKVKESFLIILPVTAVGFHVYAKYYNKWIEDPTYRVFWGRYRRREWIDAQVRDLVNRGRTEGARIFIDKKSGKLTEALVTPGKHRGIFEIMARSKTTLGYWEAEIVFDGERFVLERILDLDNPAKPPTKNSGIARTLRETVRGINRDLGIFTEISLGNVESGILDAAMRAGIKIRPPTINAVSVQEAIEAAEIFVRYEKEIIKAGGNLKEAESIRTLLSDLKSGSYFKIQRALVAFEKFKPVLDQIAKDFIKFK